MNVMVNNFSMACTSAGQGVPLVLVHGYPLNRQMWQPQVETLSAHARVLAPDLRAHGDSQIVAGPFSMDQFAEDLHALLDELGISDKIFLCGLSMGGYTAFAFARKYPRRLRGLILTATRAAPDSPQAREARDQAMETARQKGVEAIVEAMAPKLLSPTTPGRRPELLDTAKSIMRRTSLEAILGDLHGLKERPDSTPTLAQISAPTLIIHGADDQLIPMEDARAMQAGIRNAKLAALPEAGHLPNLEQPALFNQAVLEFVRAN